jgi:hypothetical protein
MPSAQNLSYAESFYYSAHGQIVFAHAAAPKVVKYMLPLPERWPNFESTSTSADEYRSASGGREGETIVILLTGGTKRRQQDDVQIALDRWGDCKKQRSSVRREDGEAHDS